MFPPHVVFLMLFSLVLFPVAVVLAMAYYLKRQPRWRAEEKVKRSAPISDEDINILTRTKSRLLDDAVALYRNQTEQKRNFRN